MRANISDVTDLTRRRVNPAVFTTGLPIVVCDQQGNVIGKFHSPRKFGNALVSAELILVAGDKIHVGQIPGVVS